MAISVALVDVQSDAVCLLDVCFETRKIGRTNPINVSFSLQKLHTQLTWRVGHCLCWPLLHSRKYQVSSSPRRYSG